MIKGPFDAICIGEGEAATAELCRQLEAGERPHGIPNLWFNRDDGSVERNTTREFLQDLDALPFPDREMWAPWIEPQLGDELAVLLGRGCPYACTYCSNHVLKRVARGRYVRMRSPENIVGEMAAIHAQYPYRKIYFEVESIALHKKWAFELMRRVAAFNATIDNAIAYGCNYRIAPQAIDDDLFAAFRAANVYKINIGLESGSERVRREVLKRDYSNDDFLRVTEWRGGTD